MKRTLLRCSALMVAALALGGGTLLGAAPAGAVLPSGQVAVAAGGSDTTDVLMKDIMASLDNRTLTVGGASTVVRTYNIPAFSPGSYLVPGEGPGNDCPADVSWVKDPLGPASNSAPTKGIAPFGSSAGRNYLAAENGGTGPGSSPGTDFGCIDVARSSSGPRAAGGGDKATFEYYGFAFDAMSWASTSLKAPATLTRQQITDIYDCVITNWDQVGGTSGPIVRYMPQVGSGTRAFFISDILVGKSSSYVPPNPGGACANFIYVEENNGKEVRAADIDKAIFPYSAAVWSFQSLNSINPTLDKRQGAQLKGITSTAGVRGTPIRWNGTDRQYQLDTTASGVIKESNVKLANPSWSEAGGNFPGVRFAFNVLDNVGNRRGYQAAWQLLGFANNPGGSKSALCDATPAGSGAEQFAIILSNGYAPLPATANSTSNLAGSTCRFFPGVN